MPVIELSHIRKTYHTGDEDTVALQDISLSINHGEFIAIMGPSTSCKSSRMHVLGRVDTPT